MLVFVEQQKGPATRVAHGGVLFRGTAQVVHLGDLGGEQGEVRGQALESAVEQEQKEQGLEEEEQEVDVMGGVVAVQVLDETVLVVS